jgi:hypothetical protein
VHKLVTVFAKPLPVTKTISEFMAHPDCSLLPRQVRNTMTPSQRLSNFYHDTRIAQTTPTWTAKTRAPVSLGSSGHSIPSSHRDNFAAKVPRLYPVLTSGNATSLYCWAVRWHSVCRKTIPPILIYLMFDLTGLLK